MWAWLVAGAAGGCLQGGTVFEQQLTYGQALGLKGAGGDGGSSTTTLPPMPQVPDNGATPSPTEPARQGPAITIRGRARLLADSGGLGHHFGRPGTSFGVRIRGSGLSITLQRRQGDDEVRFGRSIDGMLQPPLSMQGIGPQTLTIADNLPAGDHEIWWTHFGDSINSGSFDQLISIDAGALWLAAPTLPKRVVEVIGASASTGYGILPETFGCQGWLSQDPTQAWIELVAKNVDAMAVQSGTAAMSVYYDYNYQHRWIASKVWPRVDPVESTSLWDSAAAPQPDVVFVDLTGIDWDHAGNDGLAPAAVGQAYSQTMSAFLEQVWAAYPNTFIYLFINSGIDASRRTVLRGLFDTILATARGAGHARCGLIEAPFTLDGTAGCNGHPLASAHKSMADLVTAELRRTFAW